MVEEYEELRLEKDGVVVAYFAPHFKISPVLKNDLKKFVLPRARGQAIRDMRIIVMEVIVQGTFVDSDGLPPLHATALETLFGKSPVTAVDQVNRLEYYGWFGGKMKLYVGTDRYNADDLSELDIEDGRYPTVFIAEVRPSNLAGLTKREYTIRFDVGFQK